MSKSGQDTIYAMVTDRITAALRAGTVPWHEGWRTGGGLPLSMSTRKPYRGANVFLLWVMAVSNGYSSQFWGTYKHITELGGQVRKGEKSTPVIFWKRLRVDDRSGATDEHGRPVKVTIPLLRFYNVFNADQADWADAPKWLHPEPAPELAESAETVIKGYLDGGPQVRTGPQPVYSPVTDTVRWPADEDYISAGELYATRFHELAHSTGHKSRLNRPGVMLDHTIEKYADEELVAELASAMLCAVTGTDGAFDNSAAYVAGWLSRLEDDPKLIVSASARAQKAADMIQGITWNDNEEE